jgi:predicted nucleotidyltransferase
MDSHTREANREALFTGIREATLAAYEERLVSLAVFGSWARGAATPASDLDLLVVAEPLPPSRMKRVREFRPVADATQTVRSRIWSEQHAEVELSPVFKTPAELAGGSPLYLDMTLWRVVLFDRGDVLTTFLEGLCGRMQALGSRRVPFKGGMFWDYKPDFRPGEVVEL